MLFFLKRKDIKGVILVKLKFVKGFVLRVILSCGCGLSTFAALRRVNGLLDACCPPLLRFGR